MGEREGSWFDRLPFLLQHTLLMVAPALLAEAAHTWLPWAQETWGGSVAGAIAVTLASLVVTRLTEQYGTGSKKALT